MQGSDKTFVAFEFADKLAAIGVEVVDDLVVSPGQDSARVGTKFYTGEPPVSTGEFLDAKARGKVPEFGDAVAAGGDDQISSELDCVNRTTVAAKSAE